MALSPARWHVASQSPYPWEQAALDYLHQNLPDEDPWHVWGLFEFIAPNGALYEVDALVLSPHGLWLIEIKSPPGILRGNQQTWTFAHEGHTIARDNPVFLTNKKAKAFRSRLERERQTRGVQVPFVDILVFCSAENLTCELNNDARAWVCARDDNEAARQGKVSGVVSALREGRVLGTNRAWQYTIQPRQAAGLALAIESSLRTSSRRERVGDYRLQNLLDEGPGFQDWVAQHQSLKNTARRARCYLVSQQSTPQERESILRAARREYTLLDGLTHTGILPVREFITTERGPVVLFEHHPEALRLDHWLVREEGKVDQCVALGILEQLVDAVREAHSHSLVHRALSPRSILALTESDSSTGAPRIRIANWPIAHRRSPAHQGTTSGTIHIDDLVEDDAKAYMAPEAVADLPNANEAADVFSLGAIAFRLFTGKPPAPNHLELTRVLNEHAGLKLSSVVNGISPSLEDLIFCATQANPILRYDLDEFSKGLERVWEELTEPDHPKEDPYSAHKGDKLHDDKTREVFEVEERLGQGASALALRVKDKEGKRLVLKIARGEEHAETLRREHETLQGLRDSTIVRAHRSLTIGGYAAILLQDAGDSLASCLRRDGRLGLEMLQNLGEDLLHALTYLEGEGVFHRDLKPDNMGLLDASSGTKKRKNLVLFDFSLSSAKPDNIVVGTRIYLDPFLPLRKPPCYDTQAERYAAAVSLYELATATLPKWGDGLSNPAADAKCKLVIETGLFPATCREELAAFFQQALSRDWKARFDNAREMHRAWAKVFERAKEVSKPRSDVDRAKAFAQATLETPIAALGLSAWAFNSLDRINMLTVRDLLHLREGDLISIRGIGNRTKRDIVDVRRLLKQRFPDEQEQDLPIVADLAATTLSRAQEASVDHLLDKILPDSGKDKQAREYRRSMLGLGDLPERPKHPWPTQSDAATHHGVPQPSISVAWRKGLRAWKQSASVKELRTAIFALIQKHGGSMLAEELGEAVLLQRGTLTSDPAKRRRAGLAVVRAAVAVEEVESEPRYKLCRRQASSLVAASPDAADFAELLGREADALVQEVCMVNQAKALERLHGVPRPAALTAPSDQRLLALAAASSASARISANQQELYAEGLPAEKALLLASASLGGLDKLTARDIRDRVLSRYPGSVPLPNHPALDGLLVASGLDLVWHETDQAYVRKSSTGTSASGLSLLRTSTRSSPRRPPSPPEVADALACQDRLEESLRQRGFLAIQVKANQTAHAREALGSRFADLEVVDLDELLLGEMEVEARKLKVDWPVVLRADAATPGGSDWTRLNTLVGRVIPRLRQRLAAASKQLLVVNPGLLARYGQIGVLEHLRDAAGSKDGPPGCWVLIPTTGVQSLPMIDGTAVPIVSTFQYLTLTTWWIKNALPGKAS